MEMSRTSNSQTHKCPKCGAQLRKLSAYIAQLEAENAKVRKRAAMLGNELDHLGGGFVASSERHIFHRPTCYWAQFLTNSPNLREYSSHQEAIDAGYKPCKTCCA